MATNVENPNEDTKGSYANINGLHMYYEIHGKGQALMLLPGVLSGVGTGFGKLIPLLSKTRQVIVVEFQGYGHTADIPDRPLSYEQLADDVIALLEYLNIDQAGIFGYSNGAGVALQVAMRRADVVRKLILASVTYKRSGFYPEVWTAQEELTPEALAGSPYEKEYLQTAPHPEDWPRLIAKAREFVTKPQDWPPEDIKAITAPALLIAGDSDLVCTEHISELFRLLGGGVAGDLAGMPASQMAILPGTTHSGLVSRTDLLMAMIPRFLDAPITE